MLTLDKILILTNGEKIKGKKYNYLEAKYLRTLSNPIKKEFGELVYKDNYIILVDGENSGEVFKVPEDGYMGSTYKLLNINISVNIEYVLYFLENYRNFLRNNKKGSAIPHLNKNIFYNLAIPLPPLEEQQRIVEQLDKLLPLCDNL